MFQQFIGRHSTENRTGLYGRHLDRNRYQRPTSYRPSVPVGYYRTADTYQPSETDNSGYRGEERLDSRIEWEER